jgi:hypothetical protein
MDELLKTLDESVFTPELTSKIQELYEAKMTTVASELTDKITGEYEAKLQEAEVLAESKIQAIEEKATAYAEMVKETYETKATEYAEYVKKEMEAKATEYAEYVKEELTSTLDAYVNLVVEEYIEENKIAIDESVQSAKMKAVLEGFDSLLVTTGVSLSQIVEAKSEAAVAPVVENESLKATVDKLIKENVSLKTKVNNLVKESALDSLSADMTLAQKDKFGRLAEMVIFNGSKDEYIDKLNTIVETVVQKVDAPVATITESFKEEKIDSKVDIADHKRFF